MYAGKDSSLSFGPNQQQKNLCEGEGQYAIPNPSQKGNTTKCHCYLFLEWIVYSRMLPKKKKNKMQLDVGMSPPAFSILACKCPG